MTKIGTIIVLDQNENTQQIPREQLHRATMIIKFNPEYVDQIEIIKSRYTIPGTYVKMLDLK